MVGKVKNHRTFFFFSDSVASTPRTWIRSLISIRYGMCCFSSRQVFFFLFTLLCFVELIIPSHPINRNSGALNGLSSSENADAKNLRVKLVLLGDSGVGKSCIVLRFVRGEFDATSKVTVGASFLSQTIALQDSTTVKYSALAPLYYRGAAVAVIVYDITSPESFKKAQYWVKELQKHGAPDIVMALVGNKADLHEKREVLTDDGMELAEKNGIFFIETSAKTADNINQLFEEIGKRLPRPSPSS
ncbi:hypothetical protein YC2023_044635 [Brassica napus]